MKSFIVFALFVAAAVAAPPGENPDANAQVLRYDNDNIGVEGYNYGFETSNGIAAQEQAQLKNQGTENEALEVRGSYAYPGPDGVIYTITYIANEGGYQPQGDHIPKL